MLEIVELGRWGNCGDDNNHGRYGVAMVEHNYNETMMVIDDVVIASSYPDRENYFF